MMPKVFGLVRTMPKLIKAAQRTQVGFNLHRSIGIN